MYTVSESNTPAAQARADLKEAEALCKAEDIFIQEIKFRMKEVKLLRKNAVNRHAVAAGEAIDTKVKYRCGAYEKWLRSLRKELAAHKLEHNRTKGLVGKLINELWELDIGSIGGMQTGW